MSDPVPTGKIIDHKDDFDDFDFEIQGGTRTPWEELYRTIQEVASQNDSMQFLIERKQKGDGRTFSMEAIEEAGQSVIGFILARVSHCWHRPDGSLGDAPSKAVITIRVRVNVNNEGPGD